MTKKQEKEQARQQAAAELRLLLKPGDTVCTILRHCSKSGMSRDISLIVKGADGDMQDITRTAARAMDDRLVDACGRNAIRVGGCGMDMGFSLVYNLGRTLYPQGFKLAKSQRGRNGDTSGFDPDGGYAFNHRWL